MPSTPPPLHKYVQSERWRRALERAGYRVLDDAEPPSPEDLIAATLAATERPPKD